jgi:hypothetical protein
MTEPAEPSFPVKLQSEQRCDAQKSSTLIGREVVRAGADPAIRCSPWSVPVTRTTGIKRVGVR